MNSIIFIRDMCINKKRHQRLVISKEKDMIRKMKNKTKMTTYAKKKETEEKKTGQSI